jgi:hypothetical protein
MIALGYFVMALFFWMLGHFLGSNPLNRNSEIWFKINGWAIAFAVTATTLAKFAQGGKPILDLASRILQAFIYFIAGVLAFVIYRWFDSGIPTKILLRNMMATFMILSNIIKDYTLTKDPGVANA